MTTQVLRPGLRPQGFSPSTVQRALNALQRGLDQYPHVTEIEVVEEADQTFFVVWTSKKVDGLPSSVLGHRIVVKRDSSKPSMLA